LILWDNLHLFVYRSWLHGFRALSLLMSVLLTVSTRKDQGCSLPWSSLWASIGIVVRISTNETASQLAITVVGESYRIVEIRSLTWSYLIIPVCHHTWSDRKLGCLSSSVRRLYQGCYNGRFWMKMSVRTSFSSGRPPASAVTRKRGITRGHGKNRVRTVKIASARTRVDMRRADAVKRPRGLVAARRAAMGGGN
jgi:hypothetical protein